MSVMIKLPKFNKSTYDNFLAAELDKFCRGVSQKLGGNIEFFDLDDSAQNMIMTFPISANGEGNIDPTHPLKIYFYVPANASSISSAKLNIKLSKYRVDSDVAESDGDHDHVVFERLEELEPLPLSIVEDVHRYFCNGAESNENSIYLPMSTGGGFPMQYKTHTSSGVHIHNLNMGIKEATTDPAGVSISVNGNGVASGLSGDGTESNNIDIKPRVNINAWNTITVSCSAISRVTVYGIIQAVMYS